MNSIVSAAKHPLVVLGAILFVLPYIFVILGSTVSLATEILIFIILGLGFNILLGYTGLVSFGHGAYFGLATYATALTQLHLYRGTGISILAGILSGAILGAVVG
ncbi:MAG: ABC transporter, partial [Deltaproteobacteria bacterium]|nr:ABC transporter [Deltaproteobacteria bacterium]